VVGTDAQWHTISRIQQHCSGSQRAVHWHARYKHHQQPVAFVQVQAAVAAGYCTCCCTHTHTHTHTHTCMRLVHCNTNTTHQHVNCQLQRGSQALTTMNSSKHTTRNASWQRFSRVVAKSLQALVRYKRALLLALLAKLFRYPVKIMPPPREACCRGGTSTISA
jgi:hypothetical protein